MNEEVLLDFGRARSQKKCVYRKPGDANAKNESPSRGKLIGGKSPKISILQHNVSHIILIYTFINIYQQINYINIII